MRTIITNDIETKIRTTKNISLTQKGVVLETYTSLIGDNEANELAGINIGDDPPIESYDPNTMIRVNGDVIYRDRYGMMVTNTSEGYTVYDFPSNVYVDEEVNLECDNTQTIDKDLIFNINSGLYFTGLNFIEISPYSENTRVKIFFNAKYIGDIPLISLTLQNYTNLLIEAPESSDDAEDTVDVKSLRDLYNNLNGKMFDDTQVKVKIYIIGNDNVNAKGYITFYTHTYEVDAEGNIITDSITKILEGGDATGE